MSPEHNLDKHEKQILERNSSDKIISYFVYNEPLTSDELNNQFDRPSSKPPATTAIRALEELGYVDSGIIDGNYKWKLAKELDYNELMEEVDEILSGDDDDIEMNYG